VQTDKSTVFPVTCGAGFCTPVSKLCDGGNEVQHCHVISVRIFLLWSNRRNSTKFYFSDERI